MSCVRMKGASGVSLTDHSPIACSTDTGKLGGILRVIVTSRDVDFLERDSFDTPLSDVSSTTYHCSTHCMVGCT